MVQHDVDAAEFNLFVVRDRSIRQIGDDELIAAVYRPDVMYALLPPLGAV